MGALVEGICELLWPTRCAGCDMPGTLLCDVCEGALRLIDQVHACPSCGAPHGWLVCTEWGNRELPFDAALCVGVLERPLSRMITLHKDSHERRLGPILGGLLFSAVDSMGWRPDVLCGVPASKAAVSRRGFDHGEALATDLAERLGIPCRQMLRRRRVRDQRDLNRIQRAENAAGSFEVIGNPGPCDVLLVDDVLTTGATLAGAATALREAGANRVRAAVVARAW